MGSFSELLRRRYADKLDAQANEYIDYCVDGAKRMHQMIEDLTLDAQASQAADRLVDSVDLNPVIDRVLANLQGLVEESEATIIRDQLPSVPVEAVRVQQLFKI